MPRPAPVATLLLSLLAAGCSGGPVETAGALEPGDDTLATGELVDTHTVKAEPGQWVRVEVAAEGFAPYLILHSPDGVQTDVPGGARAAATAFVAPVAGRWEVLVTSAAPGGAGAYTLVVEVADAPPMPDLPPGHPTLPGTPDGPLPPGHPTLPGGDDEGPVRTV